jgi:hypothetical protein
MQNERCRDKAVWEEKKKMKGAIENLYGTIDNVNEQRHSKMSRKISWVMETKQGEQTNKLSDSRIGGEQDSWIVVGNRS